MGVETTIPLMRIWIKPLFPRHQFESFFPEVNTGKQMCDMVFRFLGNVSFLTLHNLALYHLALYYLALYLIGNTKPSATMISNERTESEFPLVLGSFACLKKIDIPFETIITIKMCNKIYFPSVNFYPSVLDSDHNGYLDFKVICHLAMLPHKSELYRPLVTITGSKQKLYGNQDTDCPHSPQSKSAPGIPTGNRFGWSSLA